MRESGPRRLLIYCGDYHCAHHVVVDADRWSDDVRRSDLEPKFTCGACGHRGADVRPSLEGYVAWMKANRPDWAAAMKSMLGKAGLSE